MSHCVEQGIGGDPWDWDCVGGVVSLYVTYPEQGNRCRLVGRANPGPGSTLTLRLFPTSVSPTERVRDPHMKNGLNHCSQMAKEFSIAVLRISKTHIVLWWFIAA